VNSIKVTAIVPVYRGERTLAQALSSLLVQDMDGLEVIVIDDGSPDRSADIAIKMEEAGDGRLAVLRQSNCGLAATLNRGIGLARGKYIARQDQDDIVLAGRLVKQVAHLEANPDVAMVGTWAQIYAEDTPTQRYHRHPSSDEVLQLELLFDNPFVHSSMMIRADVLREMGGYCEDNSRQPPEDYELWSRIARKYRVANIPEVLTVYREVAGSMSRDGENPFLTKVIRIAAENVYHVLAPDYSAQECSALVELYHRGGMAGLRVPLTKAKARKMLDVAASRIGGDKSAWSDEFQGSHRRIRAHLDLRFLRRLVPAPLLGPARWLKHRASILLGRRRLPVS
jgi:glycosyltransferase involved in cell wall biosynthesis